MIFKFCKLVFFIIEPQGGHSCFDLLHHTRPQKTDKKSISFFMVRWDIRVPCLGPQKEDQRGFDFIII